MPDATKKEYSGFYVDILVEFMQDLPDDTVQLVYENSYRNDRSGIDDFRDFCVAHAGNLEKFLLSKTGEDYLDGFFIELVQVYCDLLACELEKDPSKAIGWTPASNDVKKHYELCLKREGCLGWFELQHKPKKPKTKKKRKEKACSTKFRHKPSTTSTSKSGPKAYRKPKRSSGKWSSRSAW